MSPLRLAGSPKRKLRATSSANVLVPALARLIPHQPSLASASSNIPSTSASATPAPPTESPETAAGDDDVEIGITALSLENESVDLVPCPCPEPVSSAGAPQNVNTRAARCAGLVQHTPDQLAQLRTDFVLDVRRRDTTAAIFLESLHGLRDPHYTSEAIKLAFKHVLYDAAVNELAKSFGSIQPKSL